MIGFVVVFLLGLQGAANAATDFDHMERLAAAEYGQKAATTIKAWRTLIDKNRTQPNTIKLERINAFVNDRIIYADDEAVWGVEDYWTTPLEVFGKGMGDCEDYAIAKYISLLLMDVPVQKLRLVYVRARMGSRTVAHMVLSYFEAPTDDPLILDNLTDAILPAKRRADLFPVFSFNHEGLWVGEERGPSTNSSARLSRWRDVLQRMRREGIDPSLTQFNPQPLSSWEKLKPRLASRNKARARPWSKVAAKCQTNPKMKKIASKHVKSTKLKAKTAKHSPPSRKIANR
ncbi:MAG: transglutaminase-like cysteine peptidase [Betaproteobacteria bacterium]|nr:transglutaminase-like cysteine peptidase [Betaproteobacteria bacterium]